ncbi:MAG: sensor histidine kinase, partial [Pseudomonadota bacterium]
NDRDAGMIDSAGVPTRSQMAIAWLLFALAPVVFLTMMYYLDQPYQVPEKYQVFPSAYQKSFSHEPPVGGWKPALNGWPEGRVGDEPFTSIWYRYDLPTTVEDRAFYNVFATATLDIWHLGERLYTSGPAKRPLYEDNSPIVLSLIDGQSDKADELAPVYVRMMREYPETNLDWVYVAPLQLALRDSAESTIFYETLPLVMLGIMGAFGFLVACMFLVRRDQPAHGWYALMMLLWGIHTGHELIADIPFDRYLWACLSYASVTWLVAELFFVNRFFGVAAPRLERAVTLISAFVVVALIVLASMASRDVSFHEFERAMRAALNIWFGLVAVIITARYWIALRQRFDFERFSLFVASGVVLGVGVRDLIYDSFKSVGLPGNTFYLQYAVLIPLSMFGVQLIRRFARDSRMAELRSSELERLADERAAALEKTTQRLSEAERRRVLAEERARLMRDMHDGLGGQLVQALALSEQGEDPDLQRSLRGAIDDLRLIVDSLSPTEDGLGDLLASYRHRVSKLLRRTNFDVEWQFDEDAIDVPLPANANLSILRIIQEAVTNAVRHSEGDALRVHVSRGRDHLEVAITDNGVGIPQDVSERGLNNMRVRATEIGGALAVKSSSDGSTVRLLLPIADDGGA